MTRTKSKLTCIKISCQNETRAASTYGGAARATDISGRAAKLQAPLLNPCFSLAKYSMAARLALTGIFSTGYGLQQEAFSQGSGIYRVLENILLFNPRDKQLKKTIKYYFILLRKSTTTYLNICLKTAPFYFPWNNSVCISLFIFMECRSHFNFLPSEYSPVDKDCIFSLASPSQ